MLNSQGIVTKFTLKTFPQTRVWVRVFQGHILSPFFTYYIGRHGFGRP